MDPSQNLEMKDDTMIAEDCPSICGNTKRLGSEQIWEEFEVVKEKKVKGEGLNELLEDSEEKSSNTALEPNITALLQFFDFIKKDCKLQDMNRRLQGESQ